MLMNILLLIHISMYLVVTEFKDLLRAIVAWEANRKILDKTIECLSQVQCG